MPRKAADITGRRFSMLEVICRAPNSKRGALRWHCLCDCGNTTTVWATSLARGNTRSCGCLAKSVTALRSITHGGARDQLYKTWRGMRRRCKYPSVNLYYRYGGRGIRVCDDWAESYESFRNWALSSGYKKGLTIDRKNTDGDYSPDNCRWVTAKEQANNRSTNVKIVYGGVEKTVAEWAEYLGINRQTLYWRVKHWSVERALCT